jgi:hypothetical protein
LCPALVAEPASSGLFLSVVFIGHKLWWMMPNVSDGCRGKASVITLEQAQNSPGSDPRSRNSPLGVPGSARKVGNREKYLATIIMNHKIKHISHD